jgi:hypothetical protein
METRVNRLAAECLVDSVKVVGVYCMCGHWVITVVDVSVFGDESFLKIHW